MATIRFFLPVALLCSAWFPCCASDIYRELVPLPRGLVRTEGAARVPVEALASPEVTFGKVSGPVDGDMGCGVGAVVRKAPGDVADQAYRIVISADGVKVVAGGEAGARYARVTLEVCDGGSMESVTIRNVTMRGYLTPVFVRLERRHAPRAGMETYMRNILMENVRGVATSPIASSITGVPGLRPRGITLRDCEFTMPGGGTAADAAKPVSELETAYPDCTMFDNRRLPAWGFYIRHADDVRFERVKLTLQGADERPEIVTDDCTGFVREGAN